MELYFLVKLGFYLSLDPELERTDFESFWQSVNFVDDDKDPVTPRVNELIYFFDLAALKVGDVNHIHNDWPRIYLLEHIPNDLFPIKTSHVVWQL